MSKPVRINMRRTRGDTYPFSFTIDLDITGGTVLLTVDPEPDPDDNSANLFQLTGAITDAAAGVVEFTLDAAEAGITPGIYFYDVQLELAGAVRTVIAGRWRVDQDITK